MATWMYELKYPGMEDVVEYGFDSYEDAYNAMSEDMAEIIDKLTVIHPDMTDEEIESDIDWNILPE